MAELLNVKRQAHIGTYKIVPKVSWQTLSATHFTADGSEPSWLEMYPVKAAKEEDELPVPVGIMSPRQAAKLFYDGLFLLEEAHQRPKALQDRLPEMAHKAFKRKQFQKQFIEAGRRVCCRLAKGLEFSPNCVAEDIFVIIILESTFGLGWRRIEEHLEGLPECQNDRDFTRIKRAKVANEVEMLWRGTDSLPESGKGKSKGPTRANMKDITDPLSWFTGYTADKQHLLDHVILVDTSKAPAALSSSQSATLKMLDELIDSLPACYEDLLPIAMQSAAPISILQQARPFNVVQVNAAWVELFGFTAAEVVGQPMTMIEGASTDKHTLEKFHDKMESGKEYKHEIISYAKDGQGFRNRMRSKHLTCRDNVAQGLVMCVMHKIEPVAAAST